MRLDNIQYEKKQCKISDIILGVFTLNVRERWIARKTGCIKRETIAASKHAEHKYSILLRFIFYVLL